MFKAGRVQAVVGEAEKMSAGGKHAAEVDRKLQYFRDNFDRMKYDEYILNGWFIGSGVVESACKCVVQQRLHQFAAHRLRGRVQPVLELAGAADAVLRDGVGRAFHQRRRARCAPEGDLVDFFLRAGADDRMSRTVTSVSSASSSRNLPPLSTAALNSAILSLGIRSREEPRVATR